VPRAHTWTPGVRRVGGRWCRARLLTTTRAALCGRVSAHARALSSPVDHDVGVVLGVLSSCATRSKRSSARRDCRARYIGSTRSSVRWVFLSNIVTYFEQVQGQNSRAGMTSRFTSVSKASHGHGKEAGSKKRGRPSTSETLGGPVAQGALTSFFGRIPAARPALCLEYKGPYDKLRRPVVLDGLVRGAPVTVAPATVLDLRLRADWLCASRTSARGWTRWRRRRRSWSRRGICWWRMGGSGRSSRSRHSSAMRVERTQVQLRSCRPCRYETRTGRHRSPTGSSLRDGGGVNKAADGVHERSDALSNVSCSTRAIGRVEVRCISAVSRLSNGRSSPMREPSCPASQVYRQHLAMQQAGRWVYYARKTASG